MKEVKSWVGGKKRRNSASSKFERELKKLKCFMKYKGAKGYLSKRPKTRVRKKS